MSSILRQVARRIIDAFKSCSWFVGSRNSSEIISSDDLEVEVETLRNGWDQLRYMYCSVKSAMAIAGIVAATTPWAAEVHRWLQAVDTLEQLIRSIFTRIQVLRNQQASHSVVDMNSLLPLVKDVIQACDLTKGFTYFAASKSNASERPLRLAYEMPLSETIALDFKINKLMDCIREENSGIIGLYGMGGSGKTTLMKKLYNNIVSADTHDFAMVIWIDVSGGYDIDKIMDSLRENCKIDDENWEGKSRVEKASKIFNDLRGKEFILFVDGAWEEINLQSIGVPVSNEANKSKILITTRFESVCDPLNAKKFKVECLELKDSLDLLCKSAGDETINSDPAMRLVARELSQECEGLPLALVTVGKAVASRRSLMHTLQNLKKSPWEVKGMVDNVFTTLKSTYDSLPTTIEKNCFLDCSLFPKGKVIMVPDLIRMWIEKGLLGNYDDVQDALNHGEDVVESLKIASLMEGYGDNSVKMHNVIRIMALWLTRKQDLEIQSSKQDVTS